MLFSEDLRCLQLLVRSCSTGGQDGTLRWGEHEGLTGTFKLTGLHSLHRHMAEGDLHTDKQPLAVLLLNAYVLYSEISKACQRFVNTVSNILAFSPST